MDLIVPDPHTALWGKTKFRCAVGKSGIIAADKKREGDMRTPAGRWPMREVFYRADRLPKPVTSLPIRALEPDDGWCEMPDDPKYNQFIKHPYPGSADRMWREDRLYDVIVVIGHNDNPIVPGLGSAIFFHLASPDFSPSAGCITIRLDDMLTVLREADINSCVDVRLA